MISHELVQYLAESAHEGQSELIQTVRSLVSRRAPLLTDTITKDEAFLEPALFSWLTARRDDIDLQQILYGYLPESVRPLRLHIMSDAKGVAHLPRVGYITGMEPCRQSALNIFEIATNWMAAPLNNSHHIHFTPARFSAAGLLEFTYYMDPILWPLFVESKNVHATTVAVDEVSELQNSFNSALTLMRQIRPDIYQLLCIANRRTHIYQADAPNSFATLSMHGAAFLNRVERPSAVFFLDDFAHQGGHVVFNAATLNHDRYLNIDSNIKLCDIVPNSTDQRTLYSAFHGLFTLTLIVTVLLGGLRQNAFTHAQAKEAHARLGFYLLKFQHDLNNLAQSRLYTADGTALYRGFHACYESAIDTYATELHGLDYSNQGYVFHYSRFNELNRSCAA